MYQSIVLFIISEILFTTGSWQHILFLLTSNILLCRQIFRLGDVVETTKSGIDSGTIQRETSPVMMERTIQNQILAMSKVIQTEENLVDRLMTVIEKEQSHINLIHISTILHRLCKTDPEIVTRHPMWSNLVSMSCPLILKEKTNLRTAVSVIIYLVRTFGVNGNKHLIDSINKFCVTNLDGLDTGMIVQIVTTVKDLPCCDSLMERYTKIVVPDSSNRDLQYLVSKRIPLKPELLLKFKSFPVHQAASLISRKNMSKRVVDHILSHLETISETKEGSEISVLTSIWTPKSDDDSTIEGSLADDLVFFS